jgi:SNF2 family DNA or RNA helicase
MLVHLPSKRLVLNLRNPERVSAFLPTAREFDYKGSKLLAVPHRLDEVRVLRNLGINAPSPIMHHYDWPTGYPDMSPFEAQRLTAQFLTLNPRAFVLNDMGTGKTLATLWAFDYLRKLGIANKALVLSPLSTLERTWGDEIFTHFPHLNAAVLHGDKAKRQKLLASDMFDVFILNHHGINVIERELIERGLDTLIVDEGAIFRNGSTKLWKTLNRLAAKFDRIWWLTGTPTPNAPTDAWAQCRIVSPGRVPRYQGAFRDSVMRQMGPFRFVPRETATEIVREAMQPAIRFTRDECVDLPPVMHQTVQVPLTPELTAAYKLMLTTLKLEVANGQITAANEAVKRSKLLQIGCGAVFANDGESRVLENKPRVEEVKRIIEAAHTKTIVFVPFKPVLAYVAGELEADGVQVGRISGDVPAQERARIFKRFQDGDLEVLVAQPGAMSHGLTLTAANTVVWYAPTDSNETYEQANARITRPGQKHTQFIVHIQGTPVEKLAYARLKTRQKMQGMLLEAVELDR